MQPLPAGQPSGAGEEEHVCRPACACPALGGAPEYPCSQTAAPKLLHPKLLHPKMLCPKGCVPNHCTPNHCTPNHGTQTPAP